MSTKGNSKEPTSIDKLVPKKLKAAIARVDNKKYLLPDEPVNLDSFLDIMAKDGKIRQAVDLPVEIAISNINGYFHTEQKARDFVYNEIFKKINLKKILYSILTARWTGVSASYVVKELVEGMLTIRDVITIPPTSFIPSNGIGETKLKVLDKDDKETQYPIEDFIIYRHGDVFREPYGVSLLSYVFRHYGRKEEAANAWLAFLRRCAIPTTILWTEEDIFDSDKNELLEVLKDLKYEACMVIPRNSMDGKPSKELEFIEVEKNGADFSVFFDKMDKEIFTCLGIPESIFSAAGGSYSLGIVQLKTFIKSVLKCQDMISDILNNYILAPLLFANFGIVERGEINFKTTEGREWKEELEAALSWLQSPFVKEGDEIALRHRTGLNPVVKEGMQESRVKEEKDDGAGQSDKESEPDEEA